MYHGTKVRAKNLFRLLPISAILNFEITKMPNGCNHYTLLIHKLHGIETPQMQRKDCYQAKQGFEEILDCATRLPVTRSFDVFFDLGLNKRLSNTPLTQGLRPFCLHCATTKLAKSPLKAERRQNGCLGRSMVVHRTFRHRHGRHGRREQSHKGRRGGRSLTGRSKEAGGRHTHRHGGRMDAQWSAIGRPVKNTYCCEHRVSIWATLLPSLYHYCASFGRPIASIERSPGRLLCLHAAWGWWFETPSWSLWRQCNVVCRCAMGEWPWLWTILLMTSLMISSCQKVGQILNHRNVLHI